MKEDFVKDYREIQMNKSEIDTSRSEIDKATSDQIMKLVVERYKKSISGAQIKTGLVIKQHWMNNAETLKNTLVAIITGSDIQHVNLDDMALSKAREMLGNPGFSTQMDY